MYINLKQLSVWCMTLLIVMANTQSLPAYAAKKSTHSKTQHLEANFQPDYRPDASSDEGGFWFQVDKIEEKMLESPDVIRDSALNQYVSNIVCDIAGEYCDDIRVYLVKNPHFNASMYPNGMMHVWSGLFLRVGDEAELATVLAHEIGHFLRSHQIEQWRKVRNGASAAIFFDLALGGLATLAVLSNSFSFSRHQETEADIFGLQLMVKAGYSPGAPSDLWQYVYEEGEADKSKKKKGTFWASHPKSVDRMKRLKSESVSLLRDDKTFKTNQQDYIKVVTPHYYDFMQDHMALRDLGRTERLLQKHEKVGFPKGLVSFFKAELHKLRKQKGDLEKSIQFYKESIASENTPAEAYRELGYILIKQKDPTAKEYFEQYLNKAPDASDRDMVSFYLNSI